MRSRTDELLEEVADACLALGISLFLTGFTSLFLTGYDEPNLMVLGVIFMMCSFTHTIIKVRDNARAEHQERESILNTIIFGFKRWAARVSGSRRQQERLREVQSD